MKAFVVKSKRLTRLKDQSSNRLDQNLFPYVKDPPAELVPPGRSPSGYGSGGLSPLAPSGSLRSARPTWHKAPSARMTNTEGKQRLIIFIAGGVTYSEIRLAYTLGQQLGKDIYIGKSVEPD
jgi:syntaxin-binding protein 1